MVDARPNRPVVGQSPFVVLVDDDQAVLQALTFALESEGIPVRSFASAKAALDDAGIADAGVLIVDYRLPGMNGLELIGALRQRDVRARAVLITTQPGPALREAAETAGIPIIEKPLLDDRLLKAIRGEGPP